MLTSTTTASDDERALLQERLALFAKWAFTLTLITDALGVVIDGFQPAWTTSWALDRSINTILLVMWLLARQGARSVGFLRMLDAAGALSAAVVVALMGRFLATSVAPDLLVTRGGGPVPTTVESALIDAYAVATIMLGGAIMFTFRAATLPSSPKRTLFVTGVLGSPFALVPVWLGPAVEGSLVLRSAPGAWADLLNYGIWWSIVTAGCTATSRVIYGLRREVRDARRLGQYTLIEKVGEGGMGAVYRAEHARLKRPTAIKLLLPDHFSQQALARFETEVQLTASLTHPNTVTVFDYGRTDDGVFYYAMEYLEGANLVEIVSVDGRQPVARVLRILEQVASALEEAHGIGLTHRDVKPANIMLTTQGVDHDSVKLLDFGLAKPFEGAHDTKLTGDDRIVGTPRYMAPEVIRDADARGPAVDLYALGAVGYFLLTGMELFEGNTVVEICAHHLHTQPTPPSVRAGRDIPQPLETLLMQCLAKSPGERPTSAAEVVARVRQVDIEEPWTDADASSWWKKNAAALAHARRLPQRVEDMRITVAG